MGHRPAPKYVGAHDPYRLLAIHVLREWARHSRMGMRGYMYEWWCSVADVEPERFRSLRNAA